MLVETEQQRQEEFTFLNNSYNAILAILAPCDHTNLSDGSKVRSD